MQFVRLVKRSSSCPLVSSKIANWGSASKVAQTPVFVTATSAPVTLPSMLKVKEEEEEEKEEGRVWWMGRRRW